MNILKAIGVFIVKLIKKYFELWKECWYGVLFLTIILPIIIITPIITVYIPERKLNAAIEEIKYKYDNINSDSIREKTVAAYSILYKDTKWGYEDVKDSDISAGLADYRVRSFKYLEEEAFKGFAPSQFVLGYTYFHGEQDFYYVKADSIKSAYWFNEAASQNFVEAYNFIGLSFKEGRGVKIDLQKAVEFLKKGAEAGNMAAQYNYGELFFEGVKINSGNDTTILIPKDIEQAKYWWRKSATQGFESAKHRLQKIYQ